MNPDRMESQPFAPKSGQETGFPYDHIPTYLFRLYEPGSPGSSSVREVTTPVYATASNENCSDRMNLLELPPKEATKKLYHHLLWVYGHEHRCNLMSWSSSLLFVLQYGLFRNTKVNKTPFSEIQLIMIDTREFPKQTFVRDLDMLEHFHPYVSDLASKCGLPEAFPFSFVLHPSLLTSFGFAGTIPGNKTFPPARSHVLELRSKREGSMYFGEYLSQGRLDIQGRCSQVSMQRLIDTGLFTLCPLSINDWTRWAITVCDIRNTFLSTQTTDLKKVRTAIAMAQVGVGDQFAFPFAVMLLALQCREATDPSILNAFHSMFTDQELNVVDLKYDLESERLPELKQFKELMEAIRKERDGQEPESDRPEGGEPDPLVAQIEGPFKALCVNTKSLFPHRGSGGRKHVGFADE
ncbi:hypothetical protein FOPG_17734 [Fusarium oxysporum f. sp. conglutinans race 2 54008]|uniref:Uncharacterized protein n=1 Tax=Fusarium oxysporum f. sp. conglutinans race 2 54008 TaxID=1089457 RepID=X0H1X0_FUSOX|nr:hypothetical protein FOPG_17734 [Fusarium oxysporum f. sp. conglutinans race 2 54008]